MELVVFFFFKQKTAYEITRRDWSSDVCSSDLPRELRARGRRRLLGRPLTGGESGESEYGESGAAEGFGECHTTSSENLTRVHRTVGRAKRGTACGAEQERFERVGEQPSAAGWKGAGRSRPWESAVESSFQLGPLRLGSICG